MYSAIRDKTSEAYAAYVKKLVIQLLSLSESNRSARFIYQEIWMVHIGLAVSHGGQKAFEQNKARVRFPARQKNGSFF